MVCQAQRDRDSEAEIHTPERPGNAAESNIPTFAHGTSFAPAGTC